MGEAAELDGWEDVKFVDAVELQMQDSVSKAVITLLNVLARNATPTEKVFGCQIMDSPGVLISFEPMKAKPKKQGLLSKMLGKKPKVTKSTGKYTRSKIEKKLVLYFKLPQFKAAIKHDFILRSRVLQDIFKYPELTEIYDEVYQYINNPKTLIQMIKNRFGVVILDQDASLLNEALAGKNEQYQKRLRILANKSGDWTAAALKGTYRALINIPQGHLDQIDYLVHMSGEDVSKNISKTGVNNIAYDEGKEDAKFTSKQQDVKIGVEKLPFNVTHELGHVIDYRYGVLSGKGKEMRNVSKWVEVPDNAEDILKFMEESIEGPFYGGQLNEIELKLAHACALEFLKKTRINVCGAWGDWKRP